MTGFAALATLALLAMLLLALLVSAGISLLYPLCRARLVAMPPAARARRLLGWLASPLAVAALLTAASFVPSGLARLGLAADHCHDHGDSHPHLCLLHLPEDPLPARQALLPLLAIAPLLLAAVVLAHRTARLGPRLDALSRPGRAPGQRLLDTPAPLCLVAGLLRPTIYLSVGLAAKISGGSLKAALAHERAHVRARDPLRALVASLLSLLHLPWTRRTLLADFALACEQACDEQAARRIGCRVTVARAILAVERLFARSGEVAPGLACSLAGSSIEARVERLLAPPPVTRVQVRLPAAFMPLVLAALALVAADPLHHATETLLGLLAR